MYMPEEEADWEVNSDGLYVATRTFLMRRGYCCANRCRNCPYINWRQQADWQPIPAENVRPARVVPKAVAGAKAFLLYHEQQLEKAATAKKSYHEKMIAHYRRLLEHWESPRKFNF